jgi:hypothetical protein
VDEEEEEDEDEEEEDEEEEEEEEDLDVNGEVDPLRDRFSALCTGCVRGFFAAATGMMADPRMASV